MSFDDLPPMPPLIHAGASGYAERISVRARAVQAAGRCVLDIPYGDDYWQKLDIYLPPMDGRRDLPVLLFLHGGAWRNGCKEWMGFMAPAIVDLPAIFVSVSYRLAPAARFPAPAEDCVDALRWVYENIAAHGGSPDRLFYGGHSAGGHLSALVTLDHDLRASRELPADVVKGCFPVSGVYDLRAGIGDAEIERPLVNDFLARADQATAASPLLRVEGNRIPFFLTYGARDLPNLMRQAERMVAALDGAPARLVWAVYPDYDHFDTNERCDTADHPWIREVHRWMSA